MSDWLQDQKLLHEILVPCNWNDGKPVRTRHHKEWDKKVRKISGGLTILKPGKGQWVHEGDLYIDRVIPVRVLCTTREIQQIADITIQHYEQEAVFHYVVSSCAVVRQASDEQRARFIRPKQRVAASVAAQFTQGMEDNT